MIGLGRLLVVGGTGFIGFHLVSEAYNEGYEVSIISLHMPNEKHRVTGVNYLVADICDGNVLESTLKGKKFNYVVNLGGYINHSVYMRGGCNVINSHFIGTLNLVKYLDRSSLQSFVQLGSSAEYGNSFAPQSEKMREQPISPYSLGKAASSHFLQMLHKTEGFPGIILRPFLVYGPGQNKDRFLPQIIISCLRREKINTSKGEQLRDFCYVGDIVQGILRTLHQKNALGEVFNLASGEPLTIKSVVNEVVALIGSGTPQFGALPYRICENMELYADMDKTSEIIGWSASTTLKEGLKRTIPFYRKLCI